ncbi:MAG: DNA gyrase subunit A [Methanocellales archaeon]|nr:DNA gyrase subunit A [Methanocellales archaeon]MDD3291014.1 DNA gyrase subunit A [Methanocellales archaeon]MDD5234899.1 DNA gyrase subunit A [Methanocellales archaeon]MDD5484731.1 DNA gyrase subunit A [Methanocellales archaeon]
MSELPVNIEEEMKSSYIDYAMSVIVGRALPDIRDGLKPVHRRILYAMHELGTSSDKPYKKSARIVGEVLGKFHPHGDVAVYDSMVRMAQDFSSRYTLIDGQGNFGSVDGDPAAAMRYTEVRLSKMAEEVLADIHKDTVDFMPNFDGSLEEPSILPAKIPVLLINGSAGIAVGMATNMPPHNLSEVIDGIILTIDNPDVSPKDMMQVIKGPDFPTGAYIVGRGGIKSAYDTGRGIIKLRAKADIKEDRILITEIPFQVNKAKLIETIADLVRENKVTDIADLRDESDRAGMCIAIELKPRANAELILNQLYKHTQLETTFGVINLVLVNGHPEVLGIKDLILQYIEHRKQVVTRRSAYELDKAEKRAHILEGLKVALEQIDAIVKIIKQSQTREEASEMMADRFALSEEQVKAILDMRLHRLIALERRKLDEEYAQLERDIKRLREILGSEREILGIIKAELTEIKEKYGDARRTMITCDEPELEMEDLIPEETVVVTLTNGGYIKRIPVETYRSQRRGGRGIKGMETKDEDFVEDLFVASTHDYLLFFTDQGRMHRLKTYEIPLASRQSKGKAIINLLNLDKDENVTAMIPIKEFDDGHFLVMATKKGIIKKTELAQFCSAYKCLRAITLKDDVLVAVRLTDGEQEIILATKHGKAIRFSEKDVRSMGRTAMGVWGIRTQEGDEVIAMDTLIKNATLLTITENGYGKRTSIEEYRKQRRGGKGIININTSRRNGSAVDMLEVLDGDEVMITTSGGIVIREPVKDIRVQGRSTQGVRLMRLDEGDKVVAVAKVVE